MCPQCHYERAELLRLIRRAHRAQRMATAFDLGLIAAQKDRISAHRNIGCNFGGVKS